MHNDDPLPNTHLAISVCVIDDPLPTHSSNGYDTDEDKETQRELCVLQGIVDHVLPRVGSHVLTLDLSHSKAASNEVVCGH